MSPIRRRHGGVGPPAARAATASAPLAVVAVGGNALTDEHEQGTAEEIVANAARMADSLARLYQDGWRVAVVHGNGPQVGNLAIQQEKGASIVPAQPLHQLCAMTQGQLGSVLARQIDRRCGAGVAVAVVTHVRVDPHDLAFAHPSKPIGPFVDAERAAEIERTSGWRLVEDAGRGYRRVVASPAPVEIVEMRAVHALLDTGHIVLAAGGGGVAVTSGPDGGLVGVDAVIDKDHAAALIAIATSARELYLLTGVDAVLLDYGTAKQRPAHNLTPADASRYLAEGQFPEGSMGPKVEAGLRFLDSGGRRVVITSAPLLAAAVSGEPGVGTRIEPMRAAAGGGS